MALAPHVRNARVALQTSLPRGGGFTAVLSPPPGSLPFVWTGILLIPLGLNHSMLLVTGLAELEPPVAKPNAQKHVRPGLLSRALADALAMVRPPLAIHASRFLPFGSLNVSDQAAFRAIGRASAVPSGRRWAGVQRAPPHPTVRRMSSRRRLCTLDRQPGAFAFFALFKSVSRPSTQPSSSPTVFSWTCTPRGQTGKRPSSCTTSLQKTAPSSITCRLVTSTD